jgi:hypothetical protein
MKTERPSCETMTKGRSHPTIQMMMAKDQREPPPIEQFVRRVTQLPY